MKKEEVAEVIREKGHELIKRLEAAIKAGNVRKVIVRDSKRKKLATFRLTVGLMGMAYAPVLAAIAALLAIVSNCTVEIVKTERE